MRRNGARGRSEIKTAKDKPDFSKLPELRDALRTAMRRGTLDVIAGQTGCTTHDLKPFANGDVSKLPGNLRGRTIQVLESHLNG